MKEGQTDRQTEREGERERGEEGGRENRGREGDVNLTVSGFMNYQFDRRW